MGTIVDDNFFSFILFFIPGFISMKIYDLLLPSERRDFSKSIYEVVAYSSLNFAFLLCLIILIPITHYTSVYLSLLILMVFVMPILWPLFFYKLLTWKKLQKYILHPFSRAWDYVFNKREAMWVIVHLKDGNMVGGRYDTNSFASSYPSKEQIYLEEVWELDENGGFKQSINNSKGVLIIDEILAIEFFESKSEPYETANQK